jgi:trinucleotide repeat-containing gene 6 protein
VKKLPRYGGVFLFGCSVVLIICIFQAQGALNNCVLGNTTIFAESPAEAEVHALLQHLHVNQPQGPPVASGWGSMRGGPNSSGGQSAPPQQAPQQTPQQGPTKPPPDAWGGGSTGGGGSQLWPSPSSSSLWGASTLDGSDQHRATPSSLNSFLPGDLLGEGSM